MNLVEAFQDLVARVPELVQPLIVALAGAVPFVEGEGAAAIGIIGGIHPVIAGIAGAVGNFVCVAALVLLGAGTRRAIVERRRIAVTAGGGPAPAPEPVSPRKEKFQRALVRYGVPGVSLLGPLLLPTQFTATMLAAAGVGRARILFWQGLAIAAWTTLVTLVITGVISVAG
ncbi:small multidrug efflux protein [Microbacterium sp. NPDC055683]